MEVIYIYMNDRIWVGPEGTSKLHEDISKIPVASIPVTMLFAPKHASLDVPYDQLTEEKNSRPWCTDGSVSYIGITENWTAVLLQPPSGTTLKDTGEGKSSHWAELQAVHMVIHFAWKKKKWPDV